MWLFFFHNSEHKVVSNDPRKLEKYIREKYTYTSWSFKDIDSKTIQVIDADRDEQGFIIEVEVV